MEYIFKKQLVDLIKKKGISIRSIYNNISILNNDFPPTSLSTLERRFKNPEKMTDYEYDLIFSAYNNILTKAERTIFKSETNHSQLLKKILLNENSTNEVIVPKHIEEQVPFIDNVPINLKNLFSSYEWAPQDAKIWWSKYLNVYLALPDITKAVLLCTSYIGKDKFKNLTQNERISNFIDYTSALFSAGDITKLEKYQYIELGNILYLMGDEKVYYVEPLRAFAYSVPEQLPKGSVFDNANDSKLDVSALRFIENCKDYLKKINVMDKELFHTICFPLFLDKFEWALAWCITFYYYNNRELSNNRIYQYDGGCTTYKFSPFELSVLYYVIDLIKENDK